MRTCLYCGEQMDDREFSLEHIWPEALGGDTLPDFWRTDAVCRRCNSISGLFVDGEFIKGALGNIERWTAGVVYSDKEEPDYLIEPLAYMGIVSDLPIPSGRIVDFWLGPCGSHVVHIRPSSHSRDWITYSGGDPRAASQRSKAGRVYVGLTTEHPFWIISCLLSVKAHFRKAEGILVNMDVPTEWKYFKPIDADDESQAEEMVTVTAIKEAAREGRQIRNQVTIGTDTGSRLLAKLGLAVGHSLFGAAFMRTEYAAMLRRGFREADAGRRRMIPIRGTGYTTRGMDERLEEFLSFPGAWVLFIKRLDCELVLSVVTPSGNTMSVVVTDDPALSEQLETTYDDGVLWMTIPSLQQAIGPMSLPDYVAHQSGEILCPTLTAIARKRIDCGKLPKC